MRDEEQPAERPSEVSAHPVTGGRALRGARLHLTHELQDISIPQAWWLDRALELGLEHEVQAEWPTAVDRLDSETLAKSLLVCRQTAAPGWQSVAGQADGSLVYLTLSHGTVRARVASRANLEGACVLDLLREAFPRPAPNRRTRLPVTFWYQGYGAESRRRDIEVPAWRQIADNYAASTQAALVPVMRGFVPGRGGRLILWHGLPGTGKTYAVRALGWQWRRWCDLHYVTDPEAMFGDSTYLMDVALDEAGLEDRRWRLLVLEDTGDVLEQDVRARLGQALSRLLNLADGILGQGLRLLLLLSTNEPIDALHPAVSRPGRCAARVQFDPLSVLEAREWLARRGAAALSDRVNAESTIADLHALLEGRAVEVRDRRVGFTA